MDGAAFPYIIKIRYTIDGKDYTCRKWIGVGEKVPNTGDPIRLFYNEEKPSKVRVDI